MKALLIAALLLSGSVVAATLDNSKLGKPPLENWPSYNGDFTGQRYSTLSQINQANVQNLKPVWSYKLANAPTSRGDAVSFKATPLVVGGVMYISVPDNVFAIDARTGKEIWRYGWMDKGGHLIGNRGLGMYKNMLYFMAPDDFIVALDSGTGKE